MQEACLGGDFAAALKLQDRLTPLHAALFAEPNPAGAKCALALLGKIDEEIRLPMLPASDAARAAIKAAMATAGLLPA
jgi:4-hydroxy-tetrahydrodipicolinate synthase